MITQIIFDSEKPEDNILLKQHIKSSDMASVLREMHHNVRRYLVKHTDISEEYAKGVDAVFKEFHELLKGHNINIDDLC